MVLDSVTRSIHFIDIENLTGLPHPSLTDVRLCRKSYHRAAPIGALDQVVVACNHGAAVSVGVGWGPCRLLWRSGIDGADLALMEAMDAELTRGRFFNFVVASGDDIFARAVTQAQSRGVQVRIITRSSALSRTLALTCSRVCFVPEF